MFDPIELRSELAEVKHALAELKNTMAEVKSELAAAKVKSELAEQRDAANREMEYLHAKELLKLLDMVRYKELALQPHLAAEPTATPAEHPQGARCHRALVVVFVLLSLSSWKMASGNPGEGGMSAIFAALLGWMFKPELVRAKAQVRSKKTGALVVQCKTVGIFTRNNGRHCHEATGPYGHRHSRRNRQTLTTFKHTCSCISHNPPGVRQRAAALPVGQLVC
eukprot:TRINITY_DN9080_c0_g1_i1.p1 TRINITY_DN9080_c0_g1~~TRINITY_DN9080_c0_g1_i1.p1  ORF type:complete len:223 (+),score=35.43 TRINITY_DN9080_c0_g1_i1:348-1016(+)